ncbi:Sn1-specific diacylglycerol lipase alpha, partial [Mucuna pruriens]
MAPKNGGRIKRRALEAPKNLMEVVVILAEAIMLLGYSESWGIRHVLDLPKAIAYAAFDKDKKTVARECGERSDCVQLKVPEIIKELYELKKLLTWTMLFSSRKRFLAFLSVAGFDKEDILLRKRTARILRPAFTVMRDKESKCLIVFIRGTRSLKDTLTDALCAPVSFDHLIYSDGQHRRNMVSGHAHRGMDASASWIKKRCTTVLLDALRLYPDFKIKIVGHSLGGGTAALLTYKLREIAQFSSSTCVAFGPGINEFKAACITSELAEFGKSFIISVINGSDMVPTLSASSVHDFISESRTKEKNVPDTDSSPITAVRSRLPFAKAVAEHALTRCTEVVMKHKQRTRSLLPWSQHDSGRALSSSKLENLAEASRSETSCESLLTEELMTEYLLDEDEHNSSSEGSDDDDTDDDDDELLNQVEKLKLEKQDNIPNIHAKKKEAGKAKNITEEESVCAVTKSARHRLYPPGRIMHIVPAHSSENSNSNHNDAHEKHIHLYETHRQLYGKLRLSRGMILDHMTNKYLKMLQQLINQLEEEQFKYRG